MKAAFLPRSSIYTGDYSCLFRNSNNEIISKPHYHDNYIIEKRIEQASRLLNSGIPVNKIAENVGFHNYSYFYKAFKKYTGKSPSEYKEQQ